jgi:hypothetical protein
MVSARVARAEHLCMGTSSAGNRGKQSRAADGRRREQGTHSRGTPGNVRRLPRLPYAEAHDSEGSDVGPVAIVVRLSLPCLIASDSAGHSRPLTCSLAPGGRLLAIQSWGRDAGLEIIHKIWPKEDPFQVDRHQLLAALKAEIGDRIGTSTLFAAWNAAIYVNQIEDERLDAALKTGAYLEATQAVLQQHGGLWFNDEAFVVTRRRP